MIHPHPSAIDTPLPKPPEVVDAALASAPGWIDVPSGKGYVHCKGWPPESLRQWHVRQGLLASKSTARKQRIRSTLAA